MCFLALAMFVSVIVLGVTTESLAQEKTEITVDITKPTGRISPLIYGQFLEHICHSIDLGLHAEMLTERSFEYPRFKPSLHPLKGWSVLAGNWGEANGRAVQTKISGMAAAVVGSEEWRDYDLELAVRKLAGTGNVWIIFRFIDQSSVYIWDVGGPFGTTSTLSSRSGEGTRVIEKAPISTESNQWRRIRVRLRGESIACELDGERIHDVKDPEHTRGSAGIVLLNASAEVKDVRVISPDGGTLYEDSFTDLPPPQETAPDIGKGWESVGLETDTAQAQRDAEHPLNSSCSLRLDITPGNRKPVGVRQANVPAKEGRRYVGYVYLRGSNFSGNANVVWTNAGGTLTYAKAPLAGISADWKKVRFALAPNATDPNAALAFLFDGSGTVWLDQASLLPDNVDPSLPLREELVEVAAGLKPRIVRWPGGCFASIYHWKNGIGPVDKRPTMPIFDWEGVGGVDPNNFGTDEFIGFCRRIGAEPFIVVNLAAGPEYAAEWVEYCNGDISTPIGALRARNGHPEPYKVKYWSIDNEQWVMDSHEYGRQASETIEAMLERDPDLVFWLVGCFPGIETFNVGVLEEAGKYCDYLSIHNYWGGPYEKVMASNLDMEDWFAQLDKQMSELVPDKKIWLGFDEWNPGGIDFASGLASAALLNSMERRSDIVGMSSPALWFRHNTISSAWNNALIQFDQTRHFVSPTYLAMRMYSERFAPERVRSEVDCPGYHVEGRDTEVPYLDVIATRDTSDGRVVLKVVNRHRDEDIETRVNVLLPAGRRLALNAEVATLNADAVDAVNSLDDPERVKIIKTVIHSVNTEFQYTFPAHSATAIVMRLAK